MDSSYPKIIFFYSPVTRCLTSLEASIGGVEDIGISVFVPQNSLSPEESTDITICPCFTGPFELPDNFTPASPAYLIHHNKTHFQKDVTIRMHHYANLQSEEDCEDMAFLLASSTPEYRGSRPVYTFKEIEEAKGMFKPGEHIGEISLRHFCLVRAGKRQRTETSDSSAKKHQGDNYYSARLYRSVVHQGISAVFCMCLYDRMYIEHCDEVFTRRYTGEKSVMLARILEDHVRVYSNDPTVMFDMSSQILKRDIDIPTEISELLDYPPQLKIAAHPAKTSPKVEVEGLDRECSFNLVPFSMPFTTQTLVRMEGDTSATQQSCLFPTTNQQRARSASPSNLLNAPSPPSNQTTAPSPATPTPLNAPSPPSNQTTTPSPATPTPLNVQSAVDTVSQFPKECTVDSLLAAMDDSPLDIDDFGEVLEEVEALSPKWSRLCTKLGVKHSTLERIKTNHPNDSETCLYEALGEWLKMNYSYEKYGRPSWKQLAKAVRTLDSGLF